MLSYIYQIAYYFEHSNHLKPNTLYLNEQHFEHLRNEFSDPDDIDAISNYLGLRLILSQDAMHPHVAHLNCNWLKTSLPAQQQLKPPFPASIIAL